MSLLKNGTTIFTSLLTKFTHEFGIVLSKSLHLYRCKWKSEIPVKCTAISSSTFLQSDSKMMLERSRSFSQSRPCIRPHASASLGSGLPLKSKVLAAMKFPGSPLMQTPIPTFL